MPSSRATQKIGKLNRVGRAGVFIAFFCMKAALAGEVQFTAELSQPQIGQDDSVNLSLTVTSDGSVQVDSVTFEAPDFDLVNEYSSSFSNSYYSNGTFGMNVTQKLIKVLHPRKPGNLNIRRIRARADGKDYAAPDLVVQVSAAGAGTPPPRRYGGGGVGLRGAGKQNSASPYLLRAEINKDHAFKGEQIIVSYYLYRRASIFDIQVTSFPELKGFLREEMEMPVMGTRLDSQRVLLDGIPYDRALLVRYAAYPLQEGKLRIDPIGLKFNYRTNGGGLDDGEDPTFQFFRAIQSHSASARSEILNIDVMALPQDGRPASFSGGVGSFNLSSAVDKYEVHANEAVTLTVKIEGQGNVAAIGAPKAQWPAGVELYDSKGTAKSGKGGLGEKVFEFILIPRTPGNLTLPPLEFSYFDPNKKSYVTLNTEKVELKLGEPLAGTPVQKQVSSALPLGGDAPREDLRYLKSWDSSFAETAPWGWIFGVAVFGSVAALVGLAVDVLRRKWRLFPVRKLTGTSRTKLNSKAPNQLKAMAQRAVAGGVPWSELCVGYEQLSSLLLDAVDQLTQVGARSWSRADLQLKLQQDFGWEEGECKSLVEILEYAENVRFTTSMGVSSEVAACQNFEKWVLEAEKLLLALDKKKAYNLG